MRRRRYFSNAEIAELWRRWQSGESLIEIGDALQRDPATVHVLLRDAGGISPGVRRRSRRSLSLEEREEVSRGLAVKRSIRQIAASIGRVPSTVSREIRRNGRAHWEYRASKADRRAWRKAQRPKPCKLQVYSRLRKIVASKLLLDWSPEQITGWLRKQFPHTEEMNISHETIYRSLYVQARGVLKKELQRHLRSRHVIRRPHKGVRRQDRRQIVDAVSIRDRPPEVEDRAVPGHWEGDLLTGSGNTHIATLVERRSRFTMLVKVKGKDSTNVVTALSKQIQSLPTALRRSLTWDRGMELAQHKRFSVATDVAVYFCDPQSPWQRGTNENTNGLLRQYFPKKTPLSGFSQADLNKVARLLNERPRKTLAFQTPAECFSQTVALTG
jgi:IS30 family transposase